MKTARVLAAVLFLAGCSTYNDVVGFRDLSGAGRGDPELKQDFARCEYEMQMANSSAAYNPHLGIAGNAMLRGPGPQAFETCMTARGWEMVRR